MQQVYHFILIGGPNAGKGTNIKILQQNAAKPMRHLGTGDLIRDKIYSGTRFGKSISDKVWAGDLLNDKLVFNDIVTKYTGKYSYRTNYIFDGFPRTVVQAEDYMVLKLAMENNFAKTKDSYSITPKDYKIQTIVVGLEASDDVIMQRAQFRAKGKNPRKDDLDINIVRHRLEIYKEKTMPVLDYFDGQNIPVHIIDVNDDIFANKELMKKRETEIINILKTYNFAKDSQM
ncbi:MAG: nucleoside monophosphate kinase [Rickettsiales bacterium]|jgi:adenylate kinase|nr:nucleoside monophosphate kinase [Rickettsiales bacterium]